LNPELIAVFWWQSSSGGGGMWALLMPLVVIFAIFYFLLIMPQQKRQRQWQEMLNNLKTGDKVVTSGGIAGTIIALRGDVLHLRVPPDNLRLEILRSAVTQVVAPEESKKTA
jgi:preprotein translocase subunit YajC